eukprot:scaffold29456_cov59-Attheya_sp.AAC.1
MQPHHNRALEAVEERVSCGYWHMHDRRMYDRGAVSVEIKGCFARGIMVTCLWYDRRWLWCSKCENRMKARLGYSGDSGGGDFLARLLIYKGEEGRLSETGWIIVE